MQQQKTLEIAKLRDYPFRLLPAENVAIWAGYSDVRETLLEVIDAPRNDRVGLYEFTVLFGELGAGKSHALRYLKYIIGDEQKEDFRSPVIYLNTLKLEAKTDFVSVYRAVMGSMEEALRHAGDEMDRAINRKLTEEWKAKEENGAALLTEAEWRERRKEKILGELCPDFPALPRLLIGVKDQKPLALSILKGNKHRPEELGRYGLTNPIVNDYDAIRSLSQFVNLTTNPVVEGATPIFKAVYLFLDELDAIADFKPEQILSINQGLRDLLNASPEHFCLLCGFTGDVNKLEAYLEQAVLSRLSRDPIDIPSLDNEQAVAFLAEVLSFYRADDSVSAEYPFTNEALRQISAKTTMKTPRNLFKNSRIVLERSVLDGKLSPGGTIDVDLVDAYID